VRPARPGDADAVAALASELAVSFPFARTDFDRTFPEVLADDRVGLFVAEGEGGGLLGYVLGSAHPTFYANAPVATVAEILVRAEARRSGVGAALMAAFEAWAADRGCAVVTLATRRAAPFYTALGYSETAAYFEQRLDNGRTRHTGMGALSM
jgi:GNAT superfamily N-acetyltransferase